MSDIDNNLLEIPTKGKQGNFSFIKIKSEVDENTEKVVEASGDKDKDTPVPLKETLKKLPNESPKAVFYVDPEDELEISKLKQQMVSPSKVDLDLSDEVEKIRRKVVPEMLPFLRARFVSVVSSFWRDVRDSVELREVLMRDQSIGGLFLDQNIADQVLDAVKSSKPGIARSLKQGKDPTSLPNNLNKKNDHETVDILDFDTNSLPNRSSNQVRTEPSYKPGLVTELKERSVGVRQTESILRSSSTNPLKSISTVGPVEELEKMNLLEFRRLSSSPIDATQKIYQKIDLLGDESIEVKAKGISAWHESPLYQSYLGVGRQSMESDRSVEDVLNDDSISKNDKQLTSEEFKVIADLNKSLNF